MDTISEAERNAPIIRGISFFGKRFRDRSRSGAIVVVCISNVVRVELHLAIVEVEVRSVVELAIGIIVLFPPVHGTGS